MDWWNSCFHHLNTCHCRYNVISWSSSGRMWLWRCTLLVRARNFKPLEYQLQTWKKPAANSQFTEKSISKANQRLWPGQPRPRLNCGVRFWTNNPDLVYGRHRAYSDHACALGETSRRQDTSRTCAPCLDFWLSYTAAIWRALWN